MKRHTAYLVLLLVILSSLFSACAYVPPVPVASSQIDMKMKNMTPPPDKVLLYVYRDLAAISFAETYEISIDGYPVGKLAQTTYLVVLLESGKHRVTSKRFDDGSQVDLSINVKAGNTYFAETTKSKPYLFIVSEDKARKALTGCKLIYESEEPIQLAQLASAKNKPADVPQAQLDAPKPTATIRSDVDTLPAITTKPNKNTYAIVIGIEQYRQKLPKADFAVSDAKLMAEYLSKVMGYQEENIVTLTNENATKGDLEKYLDQWLKNVVEKNGTVFVYYSGHGAPNPATGDAYLLPYDGDPAFIEQTGYSLKRLYENLSKLPAKNIIVALDSCFSGAGGKSVSAKGSRALVRVEKTSARNIAVLTASQDNQISSSYEDKGHGVFTYFLLKGIKEMLGEDRNSRLELGDLYNYIKPQVERTSRRLYNNEQTPQLMTADEQMKSMGLR